MGVGYPFASRWESCVGSAAGSWTIGYLFGIGVGDEGDRPSVVSLRYDARVRRVPFERSRTDLSTDTCPGLQASDGESPTLDPTSYV
jgi:hypothetical protein